jgi:hypothetical protein
LSIRYNFYMTSTIEAIELHLRSYRSALQSTLELTINSLTNSHLKMDSVLHPHGSDPNVVDTAALIYSIFRLPAAIDQADKVIIGQTPEVFIEAGFSTVLSWSRVTSPARRRSMHFSKSAGILACFAGSISDIDDLVNLLIAYQHEWNKFHQLLNQKYKSFNEVTKALTDNTLHSSLDISQDDWQRLTIALGTSWQSRLKHIYREKRNLRLQLLAGSWVDYTKATQRWWKNIAQTTTNQCHLSDQKIYFVSSNSHCLLNLISGFAVKNQKEIIGLIRAQYPELYSIWQQIQNKENFLHPNDFLYYASKFFLQDISNQILYKQLQSNLNVLTIPSAHYLDINTQIFPLKTLAQSHHLDNRLKISHRNLLKKSSAIIFNIDYPLGFTAYHILNEILENVHQVKGVYILGKAAVLNSEIGDIQIPRVVFDEHTQNTYMFNNCFNSFFPFANNQGSILTHQKAVSVLGTFLENEALLQKYSENNLTVIEMESGPYLSAVTEATYDQQTPKNTIVDLNSSPFDIGIVNYTSDTPYSKAKNLGSHSLTLNGVEPVYLGSLAILQRIIDLEEKQS